MHVFTPAALRVRACQGAACTVTCAGTAPGSLACPACSLAHERGRRALSTCAAAQANAACLSTSGKLLTEKVDVMRLTFYIAPITAVFILPMLLHLEVCSRRAAVASRACACQGVRLPDRRRPGFAGRQAQRAPASSSVPGRAACHGERLSPRGCQRQAGMALAALAANGKAIAYMFGLSSALAVVHNLVNYKLVQHTSAVSATVIGEVKTIALIILSAFLLGALPVAVHKDTERSQGLRRCMRRAASQPFAAWQTGSSCTAECCCPAPVASTGCPGRPGPPSVTWPRERAGERSIFTLQLTLGCVVAMVGFCWYSHCKLYERLGSQAAAAKDAAAGTLPIAKAGGLAASLPASSGKSAFAAAGLRGRAQSATLGDEELFGVHGQDVEAGEHRPLLTGSEHRPPC
jgi:hypothetical protein